MGNLLVLPKEMEALQVKHKELLAQAQDISNRLRELRREAMKVAGWTTKCCRCSPNAISDTGFCSCCMYNHVTDEAMDSFDPDPFTESKPDRRIVKRGGKQDNDFELLEDITEPEY